MPKRIPAVIKQKSHSLNDAGLAPDLVVIRIEEEDEFRLSQRTVERWRQKEGWADYRKVADLPATMKPALDSDISHIKDPILHLSVLAAKRAVQQHDSPSNPIPSTIRLVLLDVHQQLEPGAHVLSHLRKSLWSYIKEYRESDSQSHTGPVSFEDEAQIEEIMKEE